MTLACGSPLLRREQGGSGGMEISFFSEPFIFHGFVEMSVTYPSVLPCNVYNSMAFRAFAQLCTHRHNPFWNIFMSPKKNSHLLAITLPTLPFLPALGNHQPTFCVCAFAHSGPFCKWNRTIAALCSWLLFSQHHVVRVHPCCGINQGLILSPAE